MAINKIVMGIQRLLCHLKMIDCKKEYKSGKTITKFFEVNNTVPKSDGEKLSRKIINYKLVKKSEVYATLSGKKVLARKSFYPILFGQKNYETIFGFAATKMK